jgi:hypothetical protein
MAEARGGQLKTEALAKLYDGKLRLERRNGAPLIDRPSTPLHADREPTGRLQSRSDRGETGIVILAPITRRRMDLAADQM